MNDEDVFGSYELIKILIIEGNDKLVKKVLNLKYMKNEKLFHFQDGEGMSLLHHALFLCKKEMIMFLLDTGLCDLSSQNVYGETPLMIFLTHLKLDFEIMKRLTNETNINLVDKTFGESPILASTHHEKYYEIISYMITYDNCDVNIKNRCGQTVIDKLQARKITFQIYYSKEKDEIEKIESLILKIKEHPKYAGN